MSSYWEKLVGLYVDGECSNEERLALEARAKVDPNVCRAIKRTEELRALMREIRNKPPKEFEARLREAILSSTAWDALRSRSAINTARSERAFSGALRRILGSVTIGTVAALLIGVAVFFVHFTKLEDKNADIGAIARTNRTLDTTASDGEVSTPWILTPSPEGNDPESTSKADSQENFWVVVRVEGKDQAKKQKRSLQSRCAELDVSFSKVGEDEQFYLTDVSKGQWLQISDGWNEPECEFSNALTKWDDGDQKTQTVRVAFKIESK